MPVHAVRVRRRRNQRAGQRLSHRLQAAHEGNEVRREGPREQLLAAKTVAVLADSVPLVARYGREMVTTYRAGRVGPQKAKADVEKVLAEWDVFMVIEDPAQADLVLVIREETLAPSFMSDGKARLRDTLVVFPRGGPGVAAPLWVGIDTESGLAAASGLATPDAEGVVERLRRDVAEASGSSESPCLRAT